MLPILICLIVSITSLSSTINADSSATTSSQIISTTVSSSTSSSAEDEPDNDECQNSPCKNGGTCNDGVNNYTCSCAAGYTGYNCDKNIDECENSPCKNGGTCNDGVNNYTCSCAAGYTGYNCDKNIDECDINSCQHGGTCIDGINAYSCKCIKGFSGKKCETAPSLPEGLEIKVDDKDVNKTGFEVTWEWPEMDENDENLYVYIKYTSPDGQKWNISELAYIKSKKLTHLKSGTFYELCLYIKQDDALSDECKGFNVTTRPEPVSGSNITDIHEHYITLMWNSSNMCESFNIGLSPKDNNGHSSFSVLRTENTTSYTFHNLSAGTIYSVTLVAVAGNLNSGSPYTTQITTKPYQPTDVKVLTQSTTSLTLQVNYTGSENNHLRYCTEIDSSLAPQNEDRPNLCYTSTSANKTIIMCSDENNYTITGLTAGRHYELEIYTCINSIKSDSPFIVSSLTRPINHITLEISKWYETRLEVKWTVDNSDSTDNMSITIKKDSVDSQIQEHFIPRNRSTTGTNCFDKLDAGTKYIISAFALIDSLKSENATTISNYTRPLPTNIIHETKYKNGFEFKLNTTMFYKALKINISRENWTDHNIYRSVNETGIIGIYNLSAGTYYNLNIITVIETSTGFKLESDRTTDETVFTRPGQPSQVEFPLDALHEQSFTVKITPPKVGKYDGFCVQLMNSSKHKCTSRESKDVTFDELNPGQKYKVSVLTNWNNVTSSTGITGSIYTRPKAPEAVNITQTEDNYFMISVKGTTQDYNYSFIITPKTTQNTSNITVAASGLSWNISDLESGKLYKIEVFSIVAGISSENTTNICSYTKPGQIAKDDIKGDREKTNSSKLYITWEAPKGHRDSFRYNATCKCPNADGPLDLNSSTNETYAVLSLCPGTFCNITIVAIINNDKCGKNNLSGTPSTKQISIGTRETAPEKITNFSHHNLTHNSVRLTWNAPTIKNGIIRYYVATIKNNESCFKKEYKCNHTECSIEQENGGIMEKDDCNSTHTEIYEKNTATFSWDIPKLHPYRNYTVAVTAFTIAKGEVFTDSISTLEYTPGIPVNLDVRNRTSETINLTWQPPIEKNGKITSYTVQYRFATYNCSDKGKIVTRTINSTEKPLNEIQLAGSDIHPHWTYNISVQATNKIGSGKSSAEKRITTLESKPGRISKNSVTGEENPSLFNVTMSWGLPCDTNGEILSYIVCLTNQSSFEREEVKWTRCYNTSGAATIYTLSIFPYRNYTFSVSAVNSVDTGITSEAVDIKAPIGLPERPTSVDVEAETPYIVRASWNKPNLFYGPVYYFVEAQDVKNPEKVFNSSTSTAYWTDEVTNNLTVTVKEAYWEYNITVYAVNGGTRIAAQSEICRTKESVPGNVENVILEAEEEVTKPRMLEISWKAPKEINLNGILTAYFVTWENLDGKEGILSEEFNTSSFSYVLTNIAPGNYKIEVFAASNEGNGSRVHETKVVKPGAPIKFKEETENSLLMKPSKAQPKDKETQIAVDLPVNEFLCNKSNGNPVRWGVIVAQDSEATDTPFSGNVTEFDRKVKKDYKNWFQVKDMDSMVPFIATHADWKGPCQKGQRKKREVENSNEQQQYTFLVGEEGECANNNRETYCNGELKPGRSYKVKSFVCTEGGCTETKYSKALSTDPDLTIPIAAGLSSAVVVIATVAFVIFVLRRKQIACFAKDDESVGTHTPGDGIHLDKIEHKKKNHFRQGPVKLCDFPDAVEKFHRDSDLLFADAYKMLKEKSPSHPLTAAEQQCCRPKNRYTNILPFDHSRVKLRPSDDMEGSDYINANYIPGYTSRREYIATQGPMLATIDDFWRMVWEQNVDTIVMLTKLMEKGRHKCDKYWPDLGEPVFYGDLVVSLQSESNLSDYTIKIFEIKMKEEQKMVRHFSYLKWPDMGCPETPELLLEFVKAVKQYGNNGNNEKKPNSGPTIVHCSAGVGRTGTFIAVDYLLQHIRDHDEVDIFNLVLEMRNHRLNMVQTEDQYIYIHECVKAFITTDEEEEDDEAIYVNTGFGGDDEENIYVNT